LTKYRKRKVGILLQDYIATKQDPDIVHWLLFSISSNSTEYLLKKEVFRYKSKRDKTKTAILRIQKPKPVIIEASADLKPIMYLYISKAIT
jgi:hypothetical protein